MMPADDQRAGADQPEHERLPHTLSLPALSALASHLLAPAGLDLVPCVRAEARDHALGSPAVRQFFVPVGAARPFYAALWTWHV
jgi:hypothetical protein